MKVPIEEIYILNQKGEIDLRRSRKDYLDLKDTLQRVVNKQDDPFPVSHETHVKPVVNTAFQSLKKMKDSSDPGDIQVHHIEVGNENLFFSFGLLPGMIGITINPKSNQ